MKIPHTQNITDLVYLWLRANSKPHKGRDPEDQEDCSPRFLNNLDNFCSSTQNLKEYRNVPAWDYQPLPALEALHYECKMMRNMLNHLTNEHLLFSETRLLYTTTLHSWKSTWKSRNVTNSYVVLVSMWCESLPNWTISIPMITWLRRSTSTMSPRNCVSLNTHSDSYKEWVCPRFWQQRQSSCQYVLHLAVWRRARRHCHCTIHQWSR